MADTAVGEQVAGRAGPSAGACVGVVVVLTPDASDAGVTVLDAGVEVIAVHNRTCGELLEARGQGRAVPDVRAGSGTGPAADLRFCQMISVGVPFQSDGVRQGGTAAPNAAISPC